LIGAHRAGGDVQGGVHGEEIGGLEVEADHLHGHDWPILTPWDMGHSKGMPDDDILLVHLAVLHKAWKDQICATEIRLSTR